MATTKRWQAVVEATIASKRADCGHSTPTMLVYLRTQRAGGAIEVWSVCWNCHTDDDYRVRGYRPGSDVRPIRTRTEYLDV